LFWTMDMYRTLMFFRTPGFMFCNKTYIIFSWSSRGWSLECVFVFVPRMSPPCMQRDLFLSLYYSVSQFPVLASWNLPEEKEAKTNHIKNKLHILGPQKSVTNS
jgi:hypothetical protein